MPAVNGQFFADSPILNLRDVVLSQGDTPQTFREKLARVILDEMYQFVGLLDANGMTLEINRAALEGAGIRLSDIQGKPFWEARWWQVCGETSEKQRELCGRAARGEFIRCDIEIYGRSAGEETIVIDFSLMPVRDQLGKIVFLLAEGRNITEKKAAEAELARKNEELQQLLEQVRHLDQSRAPLVFAGGGEQHRDDLLGVLPPEGPRVEPDEPPVGALELAEARLAELAADVRPLARQHLRTLGNHDGHLIPGGDDE